jgi:outer membrane protein OmpA-like peptidoglycan-associated protein
MKKLLFNCCLLFCLGADAQDSAVAAIENILPAKKVRDHYTVTGGLLGAVDFTKFRLTGNNVTNLSYQFKPGWSGGVWVNFPFGKKISFEPQVTYSSYKYGSNLTDGTAFNGTMNYLSLPLLLKFHAGPSFAIAAGVQFNLTNGVKDNGGNYTKDDFEKPSTFITGGIELFPRGRITVYGRYLHGISDMDGSGNKYTPVRFYNQAVQAGVKIKLFGDHIAAPSDTDGDGIPDASDNCPTQSGFARYQGCPIPDVDLDGINDEDDKCPKQPGLAKYNGCPVPDTDNDGINDELDKCPNQAGTAKYNGCPVPDSDGDGVNDDADRCPGVAGTAKYNGCPIPDTDDDGVNDEEDRCPTVPGTADNKGCPKIENFQASEVTFGSGKAVLTASGKRELDLAVAYMKKYPGIKIRLDGHTDSSGTDKINQPLSLSRAEAAMKYIMSKGIDASRLSAEGHGSSMPVAENKKPAGRAQNRRVEITIL